MRCSICTGRAKHKKVASELFPILTAPQSKFPDLQRLFTLLVTGNPAMKKYLETSFAKPWWHNLFESTGGGGRPKILVVKPMTHESCWMLVLGIVLQQAGRAAWQLLRSPR